MAGFDFFDGREFSILKFAIHSLLFGIMMAYVSVPNHLARLKELGVTEFSEEALSTKQKMEVQSEITKDEFLTKLRNLNVLSISKISTKGNLITIWTKVSRHTFGEKIEVEFQELDNGINQVYISSRSKLITNFIDNGKNLNNVQVIHQILKVTV